MCRKVGVEGTDENPEPAEERLLVGGQVVIAPSQRRPKRAVPGTERVAVGGEQVQGVVEAGHDLSGARVPIHDAASSMPSGRRSVRSQMVFIADRAASAAKLR